MSKPAALSDEAYAALMAQKSGRDESLSSVILRFVPRPIRTFGDLEVHLQHLEGPVVVDAEALDRVRQRKLKASRADWHHVLDRSARGTSRSAARAGS